VLSRLIYPQFALPSILSRSANNHSARVRSSIDAKNRVTQPQRTLFSCPTQATAHPRKPTTDTHPQPICAYCTRPAPSLRVFALTSTPTHSTTLLDIACLSSSALFLLHHHKLTQHNLQWRINSQISSRLPRSSMPIPVQNLLELRADHYPLQ
jgi:hypothetical protein